MVLCEITNLIPPRWAPFTLHTQHVKRIFLLNCRFFKSIQYRVTLSMRTFEMRFNKFRIKTEIYQTEMQDHNTNIFPVKKTKFKIDICKMLSIWFCYKFDRRLLQIFEIINSYTIMIIVLINHVGRHLPCVV